MDLSLTVQPHFIPGSNRFIIKSSAWVLQQFHATNYPITSLITMSSLHNATESQYLWGSGILPWRRSSFANVHVWHSFLLERSFKSQISSSLRLFSVVNLYLESCALVFWIEPFLSVYIRQTYPKVHGFAIWVHPSHRSTCLFRWIAPVIDYIFSTNLGRKEGDFYLWSPKAHSPSPFCNRTIAWLISQLGGGKPSVPWRALLLMLKCICTSDEICTFHFVFMKGLRCTFCFLEIITHNLYTSTYPREEWRPCVKSKTLDIGGTKWILVFIRNSTTWIFQRYLCIYISLHGFRHIVRRHRIGPCMSTL